MPSFNETLQGNTHVTGLLLVDGHVISGNPTVSIAVADDVAYTTAQLLAGLILRDCNGAHRADLLPTAADLVAALQPSEGSRAVGQHFEFTVRNESGAATTITVTAPDASVTVSGTATVTQGQAGRFRLEVTSATEGAETYTAYRI
jgi:hypothetical protein